VSTSLPGKPSTLTSKVLGSDDVLLTRSLHLFDRYARA